VQGSARLVLNAPLVGRMSTSDSSTLMTWPWAHTSAALGNHTSSPGARAECWDARAERWGAFRARTRASAGASVSQGGRRARSWGKISASARRSASPRSTTLLTESSSSSIRDPVALTGRLELEVFVGDALALPCLTASAACAALGWPQTQWPNTAADVSIRNSAQAET
jgi:hypothetical protein